MGKSLAFLLLALVSAARAEPPQPICYYHQGAALPVTFDGGRVLTEGTLNHEPISLLVDSGAETTLLNRSEVKKRGLSMGSTNVHNYGVSGETTTSITLIDDITIGLAHSDAIWLHVIDDTAAPFPWGGLVGADFLFRSDVEISPGEGQIKFFVARNCDTAFLARWDGDIFYVELHHGAGTDNRPMVTVEVNGHKVQALIDSGAAISVIDNSVAEALGISQTSPGVTAGKTMNGVGRHAINSWVAPFESFTIGAETVENVRITVADLWGAIRRDHNDQRTFEMIQSMPGMLLGADFLRAHHVLFAQSQQRFYFSYLGGKVFRTE